LNDGCSDFFRILAMLGGGTRSNPEILGLLFFKKCQKIMDEGRVNRRITVILGDTGFKSALRLVPDGS
jgi:hypothetical protein